MGRFWFSLVSAICQKTLVFLVFPVLPVHKPYYLLYFSYTFLLSQIPWFSVYFLQGLPPNHIIPRTKSMVQIAAGVFSHERATRLFFLFHVLPVQTHGWSSYFCKRRPASISLWIPTLVQTFLQTFPPLVQTFLQTFP